MGIAVLDAGVWSGVQPCSPRWGYLGTRFREVERGLQFMSAAIAWMLVLLLSAALILVALSAKAEYRAVYHMDCASFAYES